jgi:hypothetical protein
MSTTVGIIILISGRPLPSLCDTFPQRGQEYPCRLIYLVPFVGNEGTRSASPPQAELVLWSEDQDHLKVIDIVIEVCYLPQQGAELTPRPPLLGREGS